MQLVQFHDLGKISYQSAWDYQTILQQKLLHKKLNFSRKEDKNVVHHLLFCEHLPVYTLGKSGSMDHLLIDDKELANSQLEFYKINRGGDITFHGPGQLTIYPIFDLECFYRDVHRYVRELEEVIIQVLKLYKIEGVRNDGFTGVWVNDDRSKRKLCALGVHLSRWVSLHGLGFNVNTDLNYFNNIVPCGIQENDREVSSIKEELGKEINIQDLKTNVKKAFAELFNLEYLEP